MLAHDDCLLVTIMFCVKMGKCIITRPTYQQQHHSSFHLQSIVGVLHYHMSKTVETYLQVLTNLYYVGVCFCKYEMLIRHVIN